MGNFITKLFNDPCDDEIPILKNLFELSNKTTDINELKELYDTSIKYVECETEEAKDLKNKIYLIFQERIKEISMQKYEETIKFEPQNSNSITEYEKELEEINVLISEIDEYNLYYRLDQSIENIIATLEKRRIELIEEIKKIKENLIFTYTRELVAFIYCGYPISKTSSGYSDGDEKKLYESIKSFLQTRISTDVYLKLIQFSEFITLLFPFDDKKYIELLNTSSLNNFDNKIFTDYLTTKLLTTLEKLGTYYSKFYYDHTENVDEINREYLNDKELSIKYISSTGDFYQETKKFLKTKSIEHWKSLIFMSGKKNVTDTVINYIPSSTPIYLHYIEQYEAIIWILNTLFYNLGDQNFGGGYTYNNIIPFSYDEIFSPTPWDLKLIKTESINYDKQNKIWEESKQQLELILNEKQYKKFPLELTVDLKSKINSTNEITKHYLKETYTKLKLKPLGALKFDGDKSDVNLTLPYKLLIKLTNNFDFNRRANSSNVFLYNAIDYMCGSIDEKNLDKQEFTYWVYYNVIPSVCEWKIIFPIQTLCTNMTINTNDYNKLRKQNYKTDEEIFDIMIDRSTLYEKSNGNF